MSPGSSAALLGLPSAHDQAQKQAREPAPGLDAEPASTSPCATADSSTILAPSPEEAVSAPSHDTVAPPSTVILSSPCDTDINSQALLSNTASHSPPGNTFTAASTEASAPLPTTTDGTAESKPPQDAMRLGRAKAVLDESVKSGQTKASTEQRQAQRRRNYAVTSSLTDYEADLTSTDRAKQKEAIRKYLGERVKNDWQWEWPRPEQPPAACPVDPSNQPPASVERNSVETNLFEDHVEPFGEDWKERDEWLTDSSDDGSMKVPAPSHTVSSHDTPTPASKSEPAIPFSPCAVGHSLGKTQTERKRRRKKRLADEMAWNDGLRCFVARRDDWTGARKLRVSPSGFSPGKGTPTRSSASSRDGGSSTAIEPEDDDGVWADDVEIPIAPPVLPTENAMRASIVPGAYNTIYDKVVVQSLSPSCPMNLKDVTRSCVQGWKRDGEWPPKPSIPETPSKKAPRKLSVASMLGLNDKERERDRAVPAKAGEAAAAKDGAKDEKDGKGGGIRNSIQKMLHLGKRGG